MKTATRPLTHTVVVVMAIANGAIVIALESHGARLGIGVVRTHLENLWCGWLELSVDWSVLLQVEILAISAWVWALLKAVMEVFVDVYVVRVVLYYVCLSACVFVCLSVNGHWRTGRWFDRHVEVTLFLNVVLAFS